MGVTGLWRLIEPAGKPVPVETLENKVLAVDISIWLHQVVKGYQDARGAPLPNAHLMGLFQRLCKLLYFRIKPVFVFDGAFPELKKETIAKRQDNKLKLNSESERLKKEIFLLLSKKTAIGSILGQQISPTKGNSLQNDDNDDIFKLPALPEQDEIESESEDEHNSSGSMIDLHSVDVESEGFKSLPVKEKYDLLVELKETRKMNSWGKLHELPKKSDNFSSFQMERLLKRRKVQECLEETEKEMGGTCMSLNELESLLQEEGIETKMDSLPSRRIASNNTTRFLLIKDMKKAIEEAKHKQKSEQLKNEPSTSKEIKTDFIKETEKIEVRKDELDEDLEKAIKMSLECESNQSTVQNEPDLLDSSVVLESDYSDSENELEKPDMSCAKAYIKQYSDFTYSAIDEIVAKNSKLNKLKAKSIDVNEILQELEEEDTIIVEKIDLSSDGNSSDIKIVEDVTASPEIIVLNDTLVNPINKCEVGSSQSLVNLNEGDVSHSSSNNIKSVEPLDYQNSSSDEEFEEVPDTTKSRPVVELNLKAAVELEDDIFADVFETKVKNASPSINEEISYKNTIKMNEENNKDNSNVSGPSEIHINTENMNIDQVKLSEEEVNVDQNLNGDSNNETITLENELKSTEFDHSEIESTAVDKSVATKIDEEHLNKLVEEIDNQEQDLLNEKAKLDRIGRNITQEMTKDVKELLQIFGIPYVVAPMEAEAQCAFLETANLTHGTITDDSDIWLFGGKTVYKNFFNHKKHVLQFVADRIDKSFNLNREQLILLALLVGSDYTTGVSGVGPVTAMEILASFPYKKKELISETSNQLRYTKLTAGLQEFKTWVRTGKRTDNTSLKKKLRNVDVDNDFPSVRVVQAYLEPNVEKSKDSFTWGEPDITILRDYAKAKFGWSQNKLDEIIKPVIKRLLERKHQRNIKEYFKRTVQIENSMEEHMSKRVKAAVRKMGPDNEKLELDNETGEKKRTKSRKRKITGTKTKDKELATSSNTEDSIIKELTLKSETIDLPSKGIITEPFNIKVPKLDRYQEIIPQREKDRDSILQNKLRAIELFRKNNIVGKQRKFKRKPLVPKAEAELSENSDSN